MAKQVCKITEEQAELNSLILKRVVEKTAKYDSRILELQRKLDYFNWGIK